MSFIKDSYIAEVDGFKVGVAVFDRRLECLSNAILNGGDSVADCMFIMQVGRDYDHTDPRAHAASVRDALGLPEMCLGMMTAAEVGRVFNIQHADHRGMHVSAIATAGLSNHVVAGEELENYPERRLVSDSRAAALAGTINIAVVSPVPLTTEGKVNMMMPLVEAKSAAMADRGYRETGTTSDAMAVLSPVGEDRRDYSGTGSDLGIAAARAVRRAVGWAMDARGEHPVKEEPLRLLRNLGYTPEDLLALSCSDIQLDDFMARFAESMKDVRVRSLLDLALFCADRADSMAEDGDPGDRELILTIIRDVTGIVPDRSSGTVEAAVAAICRHAVGS